MIFLQVSLKFAVCSLEQPVTAIAWRATRASTFSGHFCPRPDIDSEYIVLKESVYFDFFSSSVPEESLIHALDPVLKRDAAREAPEF